LLLGVGVALLATGLAAVAGTSPAEPGADERMLRQSALPTDGPGLLAFFRNRSVDEADARLSALVRQLGDDSFTRREQASRQLVTIGPRARAALQEALKDPDPEVVHRARECLEQIGKGASAQVIAAAVRVLCRRHPAGTAEVLLRYLPSADADGVAAEVRSGLEAVAVRDGKVDPALLAAMSDANPLRRAAAGAAVASCGIAEYLPAARKLGADPDAGVRLRVSLALAHAGDREAVPILIGLLDQPDPEDCETAENMLLRVAGASAPYDRVGADPAVRQRRRQAWEAWWSENRERLAVAQLRNATRTLDDTLVVLLDRGEVVYLDAANRPVWTIRGLALPLDAQLLPGRDRVLIAEHDGNRVTERDLKGDVKWEFKEEECLAAQRLRNGNTFIASRRRLLEVDNDGKEVFSYTRPDGGIFMKALKLPNGDLACVTQLGVPARFVRLTPAGRDFREVQNFPCMVSTSGGRIDVLANGHVLVAEMNNNRVVEFDADGREVRWLPVDQPVAVIHLPNGHWMATSMTEKRAVELDRAGREIWQFKRDDTRVTRALRQ
jgi:HEAT repeat protein